ncbi:hypothetical protein [Oceanobacillus saliphilus]|uniref:hypothetical protein n=1 Tax=Oceanobacillus saliphilus TaxID=2925834 RepID=UPI00201D59BE|nr:hypothetical protein [Oceanobacillus saliphilus]
MQVALPRVQDAGKVQENIMKQGQHFQESLGQIQMKQEERKRKKVNESEETTKINADKENSESKVERNSKRSDKEIEIDHPFLGKQIDFNG